MASALANLRDHLAIIQDLERAARLLSWDQETYMPEKGATARAQQLSTLKRVAHERFTSDRTGELLASLKTDLSEESSLPADLYRVTKRDFERKRCLPSKLVAEFSEAASKAQQAWKKAREDDDFTTFAPHLTKLVDLSREKAEAYGYDATPYDALLETYEPGMTTAKLESIFNPLRSELVPFVEAIEESEEPDTSFLQQEFDEDDQWEFGLQVARDFGYDMTRGRQDRAAHPFSTSFATSDVRITTRINPNEFSTGFFATLHETGHALYSQGFRADLERTPLADGASLGMHESQSRLWENLVGRSSMFWEHYLPQLKKRFPDQLGDIPLDTFVRGINRVAPSLIRVEADEVTYNLHIMLRFELERRLIEGTLDVEELPAAWNEGMTSYLGLTPESNADGVLQDVHWSLGAFGYFPTYALGNLMSVQLFDQAKRDIPELDEHIRSGEFSDLLEWLRQHIHQHGRRKQAPDMIQEITGDEIQAGPWLEYVREKFSSLYDL